MLKFSVRSQEKYNQLATLLRLICGLYMLIYIPHIFFLMVFSVVSGFAVIINQLLVLFTGKGNDGMLDFMIKTMRLSTYVNCAYYQLTDEYPPNNGDAKEGFAVQFSIDKPSGYSRGLAICRLLGIIYFMLIPHYFLLAIMGIGAGVVAVIRFILLLFTGKCPDGLQNYLVDFTRYTLRIQAYAYGLTDQYPPFNGKE